jgi:hypothetical protein
MRSGIGLPLVLLAAAFPVVATASTPISITRLAPSDSTAGPFVIHVQVTPENYPSASSVVCVVEASSDSTIVSKAWGRLEAGDRRLPRALWCNVAPTRGLGNRTIRFAFGLRRDLAEVGKFYLSIPAPSGDSIWSWEINLASYLQK